MQLPVADRAEKFSYWFDNFFASDPMAKPYVLCVVNFLFMTFFAICFHVAGSQDGVWSENFWMGFTFAADMAEDVTDTPCLLHCKLDLFRYPHGA